MATSRLSQHIVLKKFQEANETHVPHIDEALRRAAVAGTPNDLGSLLDLGANINAQDFVTGQTALHAAVISHNTTNACYLLSKYAKRGIVDKNGEAASAYLTNKHPKELTELLLDQSHYALQTQDSLTSIVSYLNNADFHSVEKVSAFWKQCSVDAQKTSLGEAGLTEEEIRFFISLPSYLQMVIYRRRIEHTAVKTIFSILMRPEKERLNTLKELNIVLPSTNIPPHQLNYYIHTQSIVLAIFKILPFDHPRLSQLYNNPYAAVALSQGLLTLEQLTIFKHSGFVRGTSDNLDILLCKNGIIALREKLITPATAPYIDNLRALLSDIGLGALREKLISLEQAKGLYHSGSSTGPFSNLPALLSTNGILALRNKYITPEQAAYVSDIKTLLSDQAIWLLHQGYLSFASYPNEKIRNAHKLITAIPYLCNEFGKTMLEEKLLNQTQAEKIPNLNALLCKNGLLALRKKMLTLEDCEQIQDLFSLLSDEGLSALGGGVVTVAQAKQHKSLAILRLKRGVEALREGYITLAQATRFHDYGGPFMASSLQALLSIHGFEALREKLITPEEASDFYHSGSCSGPFDNLADLLTPLGLSALRAKVITPQIACRTELFFLKTNDNKVIIALQKKLISLDGLKKYYYNRNQFAKDIDALVNKFYIQDENKLQPACMVLQKRWRGTLARKQLGLFKELRSQMRTANIHNLDNLVQVKRLVEAKKLTEASTMLATMKPK
jgi:hypothetical protein